MALKRSPSARASAKRKAVPLEDEVETIKHNEKREKMVAIARSFGLSRTTVLTTVHVKDDFVMC